MKLHNSVGPNPHVVRMFMAEKGITLPIVTVDLMGGENRRPPYNTAVNPAGQTPALELDDGSFVCEITTICEYLEEVQPSPALVGTTAEERAETRMWTRRIDLNICEPMTNAFRAAEGRPIFEKRIMLVGPSGADELKAIAKDRLKWFGDQMGDRQFVCGDRLTMADILLYCFLTFGAAVGQPLAAEHAWTAAWTKRMDSRPSAKA